MASAIVLKNIPQLRQAEERPNLVRENIPQAEAGKVPSEAPLSGAKRGERGRGKRTFFSLEKKILVFEGKIGSFKDKVILVLQGNCGNPKYNNNL